jgi:NAD-dependent deacetylase
VWEWYGWRRELVSRCAPNDAHAALARFALGRPGVTIVTQNVDGLHAVAARDAVGTGDPSPALPLELHGALFRTRCTRCAWSAEDRAPVDPTNVDTLPHCPSCGALARPDIVWFGAMLDQIVLERAFALARAADTCLVIGTSALVHPAASLPLATIEGGGRGIEVNPDETPLTPLATTSIRGSATEVVPELLRGL